MGSTGRKGRREVLDGRGVTPRLLAWYARHQRDLPWRRTKDPYRIWVAEVMLQQTQVDTVIPYYKRFLSRFPTLHALAEASLEELLKVWEGLGYYARARYLHGAANEIQARHKGRIPSDWDELIRIRGIGEYSAGAILSIAFGQKVPALDGNARRVLSRLFAIRGPLDEAKTTRRLWDLTLAIMPEKAPGQFNQALMDLGSSVCKPRRPICAACPLVDLCQAHGRGIQESLPVRRRRRPTPHEEWAAAVIADAHGRLLFVRRNPTGLLGGLWKLPGGRREPGESLPTCLRREARRELGITIRIGKPIASLDHAFTHFRMTLHAFSGAINSGKPSALGCADLRWVKPGQWQALPLARVDRKLLDALCLRT